MADERSFYRVTSVIVCDDVRVENNGKEILIGVYNDAMVVPAFPFVTAKLCLRVTFKATRAPTQGAYFKIIGPSGEALMHHGPLPLLPQPLTDTILTGVFFPAEFKEPGDYSICFGVDEEPVEIARLSVRTPSDDEERRRVGM